VPWRGRLTGHGGGVLRRVGGGDTAPNQGGGAGGKKGDPLPLAPLLFVLEIVMGLAKDDGQEICGLIMVGGVVGGGGVRGGRASIKGGWDRAGVGRRAQ